MAEDKFFEVIAVEAVPFRAIVKAESEKKAMELAREFGILDWDDVLDEYQFIIASASEIEEELGG